MDALARLAHGAVAEADDREAGQPGAQVDLDRDAARVEARDGEGGDVGEHGRHARRGRCAGETADLLRICAAPATKFARPPAPPPSADLRAGRTRRTRRTRPSPCARTAAAVLRKDGSERAQNRCDRGISL
jgi:hypothetical protein